MPILFQKTGIYCIITTSKYYKLYYRKRGGNMQTNQLESIKDQSLTQCTECGETLFNGTESYLMECDRCLSKREE